MDLNRLYFDHQRLLMRAERGSPGEERSHDRAGAALVAGRIGCIQRALDATAATGWETLAAAEPQPLGYEPPVRENDPRRAHVKPTPNPEQAQRGREITRLALLVLGTDRAAEFLHRPNARLGARPLELAIATSEGRDRVETELGRLASHTARAD